MPIWYEWRCDPCGFNLCIPKSMKDRNDVVRCPDCLKPMKRQPGGHIDKSAAAKWREKR